ncbi:MAG TPA: alpha/beta hydrolase-fold protein [Jatrophihabitans sp.]|jgi:enterochelin esterase-like enzyme|uniref:alpha/beta hydrolase-fold protein n=1 Tax=Jatrophihabitans sp. TaxID=1932789 RepID=UPI002DFF7A88|nr:alpha/beta hydrolase-fold protein [Jatrophihabitans sp.]
MKPTSTLTPRRALAAATAGLALTLAACTASAASRPAGSTATARRVASSSTASTTSERTATARVTVTPIVIPAADRSLAAAHHFRLVSTIYWSPALRLERRLIVMLPDAYYRRATSRFPVVEMLHGHPGSPLDLFTRTKGDVAETAAGPGIGPFIGLMPDGSGPLIDDSWWANIPGQAMGTAVTQDLRRWAAAHLRISDRWTYAGLSTGGYAAGYLPTLPQAPVYGECGLSGFYDSRMPPIPQNYTASQRIPYTPELHAADAPPVVLLVYGTTDTQTRTQTLAYIAALRRAGHPYVLRTYPGGHQWRVWHPGFAECLRLVVPAA